MLKAKLSEMQESVEIYQRLGLKSEFVYAYRMLVYLLLQAKDFVTLARELTKFVKLQSDHPNN